MEKHLIDSVLAAAYQHPMLGGLDSRIDAPLRQSLQRTPAPVVFSSELADASVTTPEDSNRYSTITFRRLLRNAGASHEFLTPTQSAWEALLAKVGGYSSDAMVRRLRGDATLLALLQESPAPFSVLAKMETFDYNNPEERLYRIVRPILLIPEIPTNIQALAWEHHNTTYEEERGLLGFHRKLTEAEYLSRS